MPAGGLGRHAKGIKLEQKLCEYRREWADWEVLFSSGCKGCNETLPSRGTRVVMFFCRLITHSLWNHKLFILNCFMISYNHMTNQNNIKKNNHPSTHPER
jgi:hypothetical protein